MLKQSFEAGGKLVGDTVLQGTSSVSEFVAPFARRLSGASDAVMTKAGGYAGVVGEAVSSVSTPVLAKGAQVAGVVSEKVGAVAQPMVDKVASVTLSVGEKVAPFVDKAATLASKGAENVTGVAVVGADKTSRLYMTVADGAKAHAAKALDYASPYVDKVANVATNLRDRAMDATKPLTEKIVNQAAQVKENIFLSRYMRSAERALADVDNIKPVGLMRDIETGKTTDLVVQVADGKYFALKPPLEGGGAYVATPLNVVSWFGEANYFGKYANFSTNWNLSESTFIPGKIVFSPDAIDAARHIYRSARMSQAAA